MTQQDFDLIFERRIRHKEDCARIAQICKDNFGVSVTPLQAMTIWSDYSAKYCAGWMTLSGSDDSDIVRVINRFLKSDHYFITGD